MTAVFLRLVLAPALALDQASSNAMPMAMVCIHGGRHFEKMKQGRMRVRQKSHWKQKEKGMLLRRLDAATWIMQRSGDDS